MTDQPRTQADVPSVYAETIARTFHRTYEALAPEHGYKTRPESRTSWDDLPHENRTLMFATVKTLLDLGVINPGPTIVPHGR